jgi:D-alanyl-D-alanine carboxypeptidase/D-alanyl-D-alanine-endopeptidase (penicillin-binding protein 4)
MRFLVVRLVLLAMATLPGLAPLLAQAPASGPAPASSPAPAPPFAGLAGRLEAVWQREEFPKRAFVGFAVADPASGAILYSQNAAQLFVPASNAKLFSTALALTRLGPEYRQATEIFAEGAFSPATGVLQGDLVLRGGGDPSLSSRRFPYSRETEDIRDYPIPALEELADSLVARGLRHVTGDLVGDDTAYLWQPFHEGWAQDDALYDYGAPVSALSVNDNFLELTVTPASSPGEPASVSTRPALPYYDVLNRMVTRNGANGRIDWEIAPGHQLLVSGSVRPGARPWRGFVAIDDPALYAARYLRDALQRRGIRMDGAARARHRFLGEPASAQGDGVPASSAPSSPAGSPLVRRESPTLAEILRPTNKESVNLFAELLLCEVARVKNGVGSRQGGIDELRAFLAELGVSQDAANLADGSGLARLSLVSPQATLRLLLAMWNGPQRAAWLESLPIAGAEGTLERRLNGASKRVVIRAKTGTLRGVTGLSGYVIAADGRALAFSAFVNNHAGPARAAREFLDKMVTELASSPWMDAP